MDESSQEEDEEPSSSTLKAQKIQNLDQELAKFRQNWRLELLKNKNFDNLSSNNENFDSSSSEKLYQLAMVCEQKGRVRDAVEFYRRALKLNPDVENQFKAPKTAIFSDKNAQKRSKTPKIDEISTTSQFLDVEKLKKSLNSHCSPEKAQKSRHIGSLPAEVLILIFKWVVSSHLDVRQLEQLSMVCRGFYVLCRRDDIWRSICQRCWPTVNLSSVENSQSNAYRNLYIEKPRLLYTGLYISKISYIRRGEENSFQDRSAFSQQWHLVTYYRYLRFFEDGHVIMVTSSDEPRDVVPRMKNRRQISQNLNALFGTYALEIEENFSSHVTCIFSRWKNESNHFSYNHETKKKGQDKDYQVFFIELQICPPKKRTSALEWRNYRIKTTYISNLAGQKCEDLNILQINERHFAPFYFSRVKSYANFSETCL